MKTGTSFCPALFSMTGRWRQKRSQVHHASVREIIDSWKVEVSLDGDMR